MSNHPHKRKGRMTKEDRRVRDERNERRGRNKAYLAAKAWAQKQERAAQRRKLRTR